MLLDICDIFYRVDLQLQSKEYVYLNSVLK
jgi:hypothetical protein